MYLFHVAISLHTRVYLSSRDPTQPCLNYFLSCLIFLLHHRHRVFAIDFIFFYLFLSRSCFINNWGVFSFYYHFNSNFFYRFCFKIIIIIIMFYLIYYIYIFQDRDDDNDWKVITRVHTASEIFYFITTFVCACVCVFMCAIFLLLWFIKIQRLFKFICVFLTKTIHTIFRHRNSNYIIQ